MTDSYTIRLTENADGEAYIEVDTHSMGEIVRSTVLVHAFGGCTTPEYVRRRFDLLSAMFADSDRVMVI